MRNSFLYRRPVTVELVFLMMLAAAPALAAQEAERPPKSSSTLITAEEIARLSASVGSAYEAVRSLRPRWLRAREVLRLPGAGGGEMQFQNIHVYQDNRDMGDIDFLKSIPAEQVHTLRYLSMAEAGARFGPTNGPGIVVTLRH
jgi:hypothetical protein